MSVAERLIWVAVVILVIATVILGLGLYSFLYSIALIATWFVDIIWQASIQIN